MRGTGRTTALVLECFGEASRNPGRWIPFQDHYSGLTPGRSILLLKQYAERWRLYYRFKIIDHRPCVYFHPDLLKDNKDDKDNSSTG